MKIVGKLDKINEETFGNGGSAFFLHVNGQKYKFGKFAPRGFSDGDWVEFEATSKQNGNYTNWTADYKTLRKSNPQQGGTPPQDTGAVERAPAKGFNPTGNDERQETISRQAAFNTAIAAAKLMQDAGAVTIPAKAKKEGVVQFYIELIDTLATNFYNKSTGKTWVIEKEGEAAEDEGESEVDNSEW